MSTSFQLYRGAKIGRCLYSSLFELIEAGKLSEEQADKVLSQFDKSMYHALDEKVNMKGSIKANLRTYRYIDNVWQFVLENVILKVWASSSSKSNGAVEKKMDCAKLICVDSKLVLKEKEEKEGRERAEAEGGVHNMELKHAAAEFIGPGYDDIKQEAGNLSGVVPGPGAGNVPSAPASADALKQENNAQQGVAKVEAIGAGMKPQDGQIKEEDDAKTESD